MPLGLISPLPPMAHSLSPTIRMVYAAKSRAKATAAIHNCAQSLLQHVATLHLSSYTFLHLLQNWPKVLCQCSDMTALLCQAVRELGSTTVGFNESDVSTRSLHAGGVMALLYTRVDADAIQLLGHWQSNIMLCYLTLQAKPIMRDFARMMLRAGAYHILVPRFERYHIISLLFGNQVVAHFLF